MGKALSDIDTALLAGIHLFAQESSEEPEVAPLSLAELQAVQAVLHSGVGRPGAHRITSIAV